MVFILEGCTYNFKVFLIENDFNLEQLAIYEIKDLIAHGYICDCSLRHWTFFKWKENFTSYYSRWVLHFNSYNGVLRRRVIIRTLGIALWEVVMLRFEIGETHPQL